MAEEFEVSKPAKEMRPGDRFIFSEEMGGEGEVVTVERIIEYAGLVDIVTEELDFRIQAMAHQWLEIAPEEGEDG